ncbi:MAG TPA: hypothetical protein VIU40_12865 [Geobacteraceae bacterium]
MSDVSNSEVKKAVGQAAGMDLTGMPENDVQAVMYAHGKGDLSTAEALLALINIALIQKGVNEGVAADWAKAGMQLGPDIVRGVVKLAGLFA